MSRCILWLNAASQALCSQDLRLDHVHRRQYIQAMFSRRISEFLVVITFGLVLLGGLVHARGASLACPDWPLCYGMVMPPMVGGILLEHSHRLLGAGVGAGTLVLLALLWRTRHRRMAALGVALVLFQGLLGGLTVLMRLPPPVSIAHLGTSMIFFAWAVLLCQRLGRGSRLGPSGDWLGERRDVMAAAALVYAQIIIGAAVRHTHASLSCGTQALTCMDQWLPTTGPQGLQTLHRVLALVAVVVVVKNTLPLLRRARTTGVLGLRPLAIGVHAVVLLQLVMGILTLKTGINTHVVVTHLALAALLWGMLVALWGRLGPQNSTANQDLQRAFVGSVAPAKF